MIITAAVALAFAASLATGAASSAAAQQMGGGQTDKRKLTTIQTAKHDAVEVRFLNLPWGERTFAYLEVGGDDYYSHRNWPFAHLTLSKSATWAGH